MKWTSLQLQTGLFGKAVGQQIATDELTSDMEESLPNATPLDRFSQALAISREELARNSGFLPTVLQKQRFSDSASFHLGGGTENPNLDKPVMNLQGSTDSDEGNSFSSSQIDRLNQLRNDLLEGISFERKGGMQVFDRDQMADRIKNVDLSSYVQGFKIGTEIGITGYMTLAGIKGLNIGGYEEQKNLKKFNLRLRVVPSNNGVGLEFVDCVGVLSNLVMSMISSNPSIDWNGLFRRNFEAWEKVALSCIEFSVFDDLGAIYKGNNRIGIERSAVLDYYSNEQWINKVFNIPLFDSLPSGENFDFRLSYRIDKQICKAFTASSLSSPLLNGHLAFQFRIFGGDTSIRDFTLIGTEAHTSHSRNQSPELLAVARNTKLNWDYTQRNYIEIWKQVTSAVLEQLFLAEHIGVQRGQKGWSLMNQMEDLWVKLGDRSWTNSIDSFPCFDVPQMTMGYDYIFGATIRPSEVSQLQFKAVNHGKWLMLGDDICQIRFRFLRTREGVLTLSLANHRGVNSAEAFRIASESFSFDWKRNFRLDDEKARKDVLDVLNREVVSGDYQDICSVFSKLEVLDVLQEQEIIGYRGTPDEFVCNIRVYRDNYHKIKFVFEEDLDLYDQETVYTKAQLKIAIFRDEEGRIRFRINDYSGYRSMQFGLSLIYNPRYDFDSSFSGDMRTKKEFLAGIIEEIIFSNQVGLDRAKSGWSVDVDKKDFLKRLRGRKWIAELSTIECLKEFLGDKRHLFVVGAIFSGQNVSAPSVIAATPRIWEFVGRMKAQVLFELHVDDKGKLFASHYADKGTRSSKLASALFNNRYDLMTRLHHYIGVPAGAFMFAVDHDIAGGDKVTYQLAKRALSKKQFEELGWDEPRAPSSRRRR